MESILDLDDEYRRTKHRVGYKKRQMRRYTETEDYEERDPVSRILGRWYKMDPVNKILGNVVECPMCYGDGLDENMRTCKTCNGSGQIVRG